MQSHSRRAIWTSDVDEFPLPGPVLVAGVDEFDPEAVWVGGDVGDVFTVEFVEELVRRASVAVDALQMLNPALLSNESLDALAVGTEKVRRQVDAAGVSDRRSCRHGAAVPW